MRVSDREDGAYLACGYTERSDQSCRRRLLRVSAGEERKMSVSICIYSNVRETLIYKANAQQCIFKYPSNNIVTRFLI